MPLQEPSLPDKQRGTILVISMILLLVLSAMGVALMSLTIMSERVSRNYSNYFAAQVRAISMTGYGLRILQSFTARQYPGPGSCTSTSTCNVIDNNFPFNGRPVLPWSSGLGVTNLQGSAQTNTWWSNHAFGYEAAYGDSGNARVLVSLLGTSTTYPDYLQTYKVTGYSTDSTGVIRSTAQTFYAWKGYRSDPYPTTTQLYGTTTCANGCAYGQCCSSGTCSSAQGICEVGEAAFVPPGWSCSQYFVTGLGYNASTCANNVAALTTVSNVLDDFGYNAITYYAQNSAFPSSLTWNSNTLPNGSMASTSGLQPYDMYYGEYDVNGNVIGISGSVSGLTGITGYQDPTTNGPNHNNVISLRIKANSGSFYFQCGTGVPNDSNDVPMANQLPFCACQNLDDYLSGGSVCTP